MNNFYVYLHKKKSDGKVFYVGKGRANRAYDFSRRSRFWNSVVKIHGIEVEIFLKDLSEHEAFSVEVDLISKYGRRQHGGVLVNLTNGGEGVSGKVWSKKEKEKMSERISGDRNVSKRADVRIILSKKMSGKNNPMKKRENSTKVSAKNTGKKASKETRLKMSIAHQGKVFSEETRKKISESKTGSKHPLFGKRLSEEYKMKISQSMIGRVVSDETRAKISASRLGKKYPRQKL